MSCANWPGLARLGTAMVAAALWASMLAATGCGSDPDRSPAGGGGAGAGGTGTGATGTGATGAGGTSTDPGTCDPDPLLTNLEPLWNGNSVDAYDCPILTFTAQYGEPDAMIFKAIIYVESRFQFDAVGCTGNDNCCPEHGWTGTECGCLGLMQTGPWCNATNLPPGCTSTGGGLLADGHVDLETSSSSGDWANSVFNPEVNIELGIAGIACNRAQAKAEFPGCTEDQYTMMAIGNFNSYGSTQGCTVYNFEYDTAVVEAYNEYATASGWPAHPYVTQ